MPNRSRMKCMCDHDYGNKKNAAFQTSARMSFKSMVYTLYRDGNMRALCATRSFVRT